jgi:hypothetical protein
MVRQVGRVIRAYAGRGSDSAPAVSQAVPLPRGSDSATAAGARGNARVQRVKAELQGAEARGCQPAVPPPPPPPPPPLPSLECSAHPFSFNALRPLLRQVEQRREPLPLECRVGNVAFSPRRSSPRRRPPWCIRTAYCLPGHDGLRTPAHSARTNAALSRCTGVGAERARSCAARRSRSLKRTCPACSSVRNPATPARAPPRSPTRTP